MAAVDEGESTSDSAKLTVERLSKDGDGATLKVAGQLDVSTEGILRAALDEAVEPPAAKIVLDVSELNFMDSSGLAVLIVAARTATVELRNPTTIVRRLITIAGLTETLQMTPDA
jgi:anti-sigma B factor antagonist